MLKSKLYEDKDGEIIVAVEKDGEVVNIITGLGEEDGPVDFRDAPPYDPADFGGLSLPEMAKELEREYTFLMEIGSGPRGLDFDVNW